ncbi:hypothetical protein HUW51_03625 [Adhaeribacter swui]|uniref:Uncharacterized protein n=1 Tax=Adhaeribacter swui TaxID=2086471 RepID=A0A7G7G3W8_9BACT|nr:hypothetical protein [Adhaeribacter swui]QNF31852.1 hypothetical protein HUW51_03625 [Adhaeribacter swui]
MLSNSWTDLIKWTNDNSGFLSLILFLVTILFGWISGLFNSLIKKPKLKVRFIEKSSFFSFFYTGNQSYEEQLNETFNLHQTGFAVYMSIANVGNMPTSIDKIYLGYYKNTTKTKLFDKQMVWLPQSHIFADFKFEYGESLVFIPPLRTRSDVFNQRRTDSLDVGESIVGVAYFEQGEAWGNLNPKSSDGDGTIKVVIKIRDVYGKHYKFKTTLKPKAIEEARTINEAFGLTTNITKD